MMGCSFVHKNGDKCPSLGNEVSMGSYLYHLCHKHNNMESVIDMLYQQDRLTVIKECQMQDTIDDLRIENDKYQELIIMHERNSISKTKKTIEYIKVLFTHLKAINSQWRLLRNNI